MNPSLRLRVSMTVTRAVYKPILKRIKHVGWARRRVGLLSRLFLRGQRLMPFQAGTIAGVPVRTSAAGGVTLLYIHGGAYVLFSARTHQGLAARMASPHGWGVVLPDYRLSPENTYPAALDDVEAVYADLIARGPVVIAGDSAGGGLTLGLLHRICSMGLPQPKAVVAFSPWTDLTLSGASIAENEANDAMLPASRMAEIRDWYLGGADPTMPDASPVFGTFAGAPPVLVQVAESEILRSDSEAVVERMQSQGVVAELDLLPDGLHAFQLMHGWFPEADEALARTDAFLARAVGGAQAATGTREASL